MKLIASIRGFVLSVMGYDGAHWPVNLRTKSEQEFFCLILRSLEARGMRTVVRSRSSPYLIEVDRKSIVGRIVPDSYMVRISIESDRIAVERFPIAVIVWAFTFWLIAVGTLLVAGTAVAIVVFFRGESEIQAVSILVPVVGAMSALMFSLPAVALMRSLGFGSRVAFREAKTVLAEHLQS